MRGRKQDERISRVDLGCDPVDDPGEIYRGLRLGRASVDADGQNVQFRLDLVRRPCELDGGARCQRGQQV